MEDAIPTYEMFWDCRSCGSEKLLGKSHRHCPNCGQAQDASWRYFPAEHEKVAVEDHRFVGVDWTCERCDTPNSAAATHCVNCGDARDGVEKDVRLRTAVGAGDQAGDRSATPVPSAEAEELEELLAPSHRKRGWLRLLLMGVALLVFAGGLFCCLVTCWTRPTTLDVTGHSWERSIAIERLAARRDGSWCSSTPSDAYSMSRSRKVRSTNRIPDGESCSTVNVDNGDGTFSTRQSCSTTYREEDVYDDWCDYTVDRWGHDHTETAKGSAVKPPPHWPSVSVTGCARLGCTRQGSRAQTYTVHLRDLDADTHGCTFDEASWARWIVGSRWQGDKGVILDNLVCSSLQPAVP